MAQLVGGIAMSHAPGLTGWPDAPPPQVRANIDASLASLRAQLEAARPEVIVAFLDDHFDNLSRRLMPPLALAVAEAHSGPAEYQLEMLKMERRREVPSSPELAEHLLRGLVRSGFDVARVGRIEYCQNLMVPLELVWPANEIPVVPVLINVFTPPLVSPSRAYDLGAAVVEVLAGRDERVLVLATGGLSHWPPFWNEQSPPDDEMLERMRRFQTDGPVVLGEDPQLFDDFGRYEIEMAAKSEQLLVNEDWDRRFLEAFAGGDVAFMRALDEEQIALDAGPGANEVLNWIALMGAMGGRPAEVLSYDVSPEWITGVAFARYRP